MAGARVPPFPVLVLNESPLTLLVEHELGVVDREVADDVRALISADRAR